MDLSYLAFALLHRLRLLEHHLFSALDQWPATPTEAHDHRSCRPDALHLPRPLDQASTSLSISRVNHSWINLIRPPAYNLDLRIDQGEMRGWRRERESRMEEEEACKSAAWGALFTVAEENFRCYGSREDCRYFAAEGITDQNATESGVLTRPVTLRLRRMPTWTLVDGVSGGTPKSPLPEAMPSSPLAVAMPTSPLAVAMRISPLAVAMHTSPLVVAMHTSPLGVAMLTSPLVVAMLTSPAALSRPFGLPPPSPPLPIKGVGVATEGSRTRKQNFPPLHFR